MHSSLHPSIVLSIVLSAFFILTFLVFMNIHHSEFTSKKANFFNFWRYQNKDNFRSMNAIISINAIAGIFFTKV